MREREIEGEKSRERTVEMRERERKTCQESKKPCAKEGEKGSERDGKEKEHTRDRREK